MLASAGATILARDLANTRSSTKGPAWLAARATRVARSSGLTAQVWSEADLRREGFAAILAVGGGAERGPRLVQLDHRPTGRSAAGRPHVVLVGKGITFDTGGISLKPREAMLGMTTDMTGSAVVLAVLAACRELGVQARVTGLMPLAENAFGAGSYRPADVVRTYDGTTVEVRNTDAEGRMVLADAMGYARAHLRPDIMVDIATLTGGSHPGPRPLLRRALCHRRPAQPRPRPRRRRGRGAALADAAGRGLPRADRLRRRGPVPDLDRSLGRRGLGDGGALPARVRRRRAVGPSRHRRPGRSDRDRGEINRGGTGFGARLLLRWLQTL